MSKRILIADDEPTIVALARQKLESKGHTVETARNGKEAMNILETMVVDLIILDVIMPVMDGVDVYKEVKKDPRTAGIPIVIMTDNRIFRESFQTLGVEHFLPKPMDAEKLLNKVDYIFTCADLQRKNKQTLVLSQDPEINNGISHVLEGHQLVVGKGTDSIDFIHTALVLTPRIALVDISVRGDVPSSDIIRALRCFTRLKEMKVLVFTAVAPEELTSQDDLERLREDKARCLEAGAHKYIGRFSPETLWESVKEFFV